MEETLTAQRRWIGVAIVAIVALLALLGCGTSDAEPTAEPTAEPPTDLAVPKPEPEPEPEPEPVEEYPHTGDADLESMWVDCAEGDGDRCDELYLLSPAGSEAERFGDECGGRQGPNEGWCGEKFAGEFVDDFLTPDIFRELAAPVIVPGLDAENCSLIEMLGPGPFIDAFKEGFTESGGFEWRPEYRDVLEEIIEEECG